MRKNLLSLLICFWASFLLAQKPKIDDVQRITGYPFTNVVITGSGFSNTASDLQVTFGNVKGTIQRATLNLIEVTVPAQARLSVIEVLNKATGLSGKSILKFMPTFNGKQPFGNNFTATSFSNPDDIFDICSADLDGDGKTDIVGSKFKDGKSNLVLLKNTSTIQPNNTTVNFSMTSIPLAVPSFSVIASDLNGDGKPEIIASRGGLTTGNSIYIFPNNSTVGNFSFGTPAQLNLAAGDFAQELSVHDLNGDGKPEIVVANGQASTLYIFQNNITGGVISAASFSRIDKVVTGAANTLALEVGDFNNDGWADIATIENTDGKKIFILANPANSTLNFTSIISIAIAGSSDLNDIASADFNKDSMLDVVVTDKATEKTYVYLNRGSFVFQSVNSTTGFPSPTSWGVDVADMNGDGFADFVTGNLSVVSPQVNVYINNGAATPGFAATTIPVAKPVWYVKTGDYDGDSKPDIALTSTNNVNSFSIDILKNQNCHVPVILGDNPLTVCGGQTLDVNAIPLQGVSYTWSNGVNAPSTSINTGNAGAFTLTAVGEGGSCNEQSSITIVVGTGTDPGTPTIAAPDGICAGNTLNLSTPDVVDTYIWKGPNGFSSGVKNPPGITNVSSVHAGIYTLQEKNGDCTSDISEKIIAVVEPASFNILGNPGSQVCSGQPLTLSVANDADYNYQWKKGGSNIVGATSSSYTIPATAVSDEGNYTVALSHKVITCSSETNAFSLDVLSAPVASFTTNPANICVGTDVTFTSTSAVDNTATVNYTWAFGDAASGTGSPASHTYLTALGVTASLTVSYSGVTGCSNTKDVSITVNSAVAPVIDVQDGATEICANGSEELTLTVSGTFNSFTWTPNGSGSSISVKAPGTYSVLTEDANGCIGNDEITLGSKTGCEGGDVPDIQIEPMKVFTPNGDGSNDFWGIKGLENYPNCSINVFDGRGRRVYAVDTSSYPLYVQGSNSPGWDGTVNGKPVPDGTYFFVLGCPSGGKPFTGTILIVR